MNNRVRRESQSVVLVQPAAAEITVFASGERKAGVEATDLPEPSGWNTEVVGCKKLGRVVVRVKVVDEELAGRRTKVLW